MNRASCCGCRPGAFTLLELMIVLVIITILGTLLLPLYGEMRARAQKTQCITNLKNLYVGAEVYVQRNGHWPQISRTSGASGAEDFANAWIAALAPNGLGRPSWICPTIQALLQEPDYTQPRFARLDYIPMNFDANELTPHKWPRQPWFIEAGNVHGNGNLLIYTDGSIGEVNDLVPK